MACAVCDHCEVDASARRDLAILAARSVAARHGINAVYPSIIKDSNNTIVDLGAANLVAKVATSTLPGRVIDTEFAVLSHLHNKDAPTGRLSDRIEHGPHDELGCRLFFLDRLEIIDAPLTAAQVLDTVRATHLALADLDLAVPDFDQNLTAATALFDDPTRTATVPSGERDFCLSVGRRLRQQLDALAWQKLVLHGDPWVGGNLVHTTSGPRLVDFEAVCRGPFEWDLSSFDGDGIGAADKDLLAVCKALRSFTVAAWCWAQPGRAPEVDEAAHWHLHVLHATFDT